MYREVENRPVLQPRNGCYIILFITVNCDISCIWASYWVCSNMFKTAPMVGLHLLGLYMQGARITAYTVNSCRSMTLAVKKEGRR